MSEWVRGKIGELTSLVTKGTTPSAKDGGFAESGVNYIKSDAVNYDGRIDRTKFVHISKEVHEKFKRSQLKAGDILFSMAGVFLGKTGVVTEDMLPANTNQALAIIRVDEKKASSKFVHFFLRQPSIIDFVNNMSGQSAQPNINFQEIRSIDIDIPPLPEQKAIASVLSNLDDKMDLLHRQNKTLEAMAETLFRQCFVEEAQEDWEVTTIGSALDTVLGGTPSTNKPEYWDGDVPWINSGEVNKFRIVDATKFITNLGLKKSNTKLLPKGTTVVAITGATLGQVSLLEIETCANQSVVGIIPNKRIPKEFVFLWVKLKIREIVLSETGGAQPHINKNDINGTEIVIPPEELLLKKIKPFEAWFSKITANVFQIRTLEKLRDTLLPKLMSGEVRVDYENQSQ